MDSSASFAYFRFWSSYFEGEDPKPFHYRDNWEFGGYKKARKDQFVDSGGIYSTFWFSGLFLLETENLPLAHAKNGETNKIVCI